MNDQELEIFLGGYRWPHPGPDLDRRVLTQALPILWRRRLARSSVKLLMFLLDILGFGYLSLILARIQQQPSDYKITLI